MGKKVRMGVAGAGGIASGFHLPKLAQHPDVELVALADVNVERASSVASSFGIGKVFGDPLEMIAAGGLDAVSICTPTGTHAQIAVAALEAGMDVLVEKPMARTGAEAAAMVQAARAGDRVLMVGQVRRFQTETEIIRGLTAGGDLGEIYYARATAVSRRGVPGGWFIDKAIAGGGAVIDIGVHALDLAWFLMGAPEPVAVSGQTFRGVAPYQTRHTAGYFAADRSAADAFSVEDGGVAHIRFAGGKSLLLEAFWAINGVPEEGFQVRLHGTRGGVAVNPLQVSYERDGLLLDATPVVRTKADMFQAEIDHFVACVQERREPLAPGEHGLTVIRMIEALYQSAQSGREIQL